MHKSYDHATKVTDPPPLPPTQTPNEHLKVKSHLITQNNPLRITTFVLMATSFSNYNFFFKTIILKKYYVFSK